MEQLFAAARAVWQDPQVRAPVRIFTWLGGINACFWLLAKIAGAFVGLFSELFWEPLWSVIAALYNIALAVLFSAVLFVAATHGAAPGDLLWRRSCGFVMLYVALGAAYFDAKTGGLTDETRFGYALGLLSFLIYAAYPPLVADPRLVDAVVLLKDMASGWVGRGLSAAFAIGLIWTASRSGLSAMFRVLAPFLYSVGAIKHPAVRVRRRDD